MDVYLVPVGGDRHELYCEAPEAPDDVPSESAPRGRVGRTVQRVQRALRDRFHRVIAEAERERRRTAAERQDRGAFGRLRGRAMRWVAESIAEQRLLWHLRGHTRATLFHPDDVDASQAIAILRRQLERDFDKHRFWLFFDLLGLVGSFLLVPIPGPNLFLYYFGFRVVGHFLSVRGARQGLDVVAWSTEACAHLTELRRAIGLDPVARDARVSDIAVRLRLEHLATFFQRTALNL